MLNTNEIKAFKLKKESGAVVPCLSLVPEGTEDIVIMIHGFGSRKDCATGELLFRRMPEAGFGVVTYDQPAHGPEEARDEPLLITNCLSSLAAVEQAVAEKYPSAGIHYFGSSFGAYITTLYLCGFPHRGHDAFLRSAAVNMPRLMLGEPGSEPDPAAIQEFREKGYILSDVGPDAVRIPYGFLEELVENDLSEKYSHRRYSDFRLEMVHGEKDSTILLPYAREFAKKFGIPLTVIKDEEHTLSDYPETPDRVADLAIRFFRVR